MYATYEEFKKAYLDVFNRMMSYSPKQVGSCHYAEQMAAMSDSHPEWAERAEMEA